MMRKVMFVLAVAGILGLGGSAWAILEAPVLQWSEPRTYAFNNWTSFGTIDDTTNTALDTIDHHIFKDTIGK